MKICLILLFTCGFVEVFSQDIQKDIDDQVWRPFIESFNRHDTDSFMSIHSRDAVRSPRDAKAVLNWNEYYQQQKKGDDQEKISGSNRSLQLRFSERIANNDLAVDVGIYKVTVSEREGNSKSYYGRFHAVLRKENGGWKILVDTDSSEGNTIGEADFQKADPLK